MSWSWPDMPDAACHTEQELPGGELIPDQHTAPRTQRDRDSAEARCARCPMRAECLTAAASAPDNYWTQDVIAGGLWPPAAEPNAFSHAKRRPRREMKRGEPDLRAALALSERLSRQQVMEVVA